MKTQVIYLEPQDDLQTIQDKINWGKSERILLVYPSSAPPLRRKLDLVQLERFSRKKGSQFAVVTDRQQIANFASELGISVFPNRRVAQLADWNQPPGKIKELDFTLSSIEEKEELQKRIETPETPNWMKNKYFRYGVISIAILSVLSILFILLPSAQIRIAPKTTLQTIKLTLKVDPEIETYNLAGMIPAEIITVTVNAETTMTTSGNIVIPNTYAEGQVTFTNLTDQEYLIPVGTVIRSGSQETLKYLTLEDIQMPAEAGAEIKVDVIAENPGESGNIPEENLTRLDGQLSFQAAVNNQSKISGGTDISSQAPSDQDYEILKKDLLDDLFILAQDEAAAQAPTQDILLSSFSYNSIVISETYSPDQIQPANELTLNLVVEYEFMIVRGKTLNAMLEQILDSHLDPGQIARENSLSIEVISSSEINRNNSNDLKINDLRQVYDQPDKIVISNMIKGKPYDEVIALLSDQNFYQEVPEIITWPSWWPWLPFSPQRINIEVSY